MRGVDVELLEEERQRGLENGQQVLEDGGGIW